ncbi:MAG: hypothetical protein JRF33_25370 [Deltaproteobacteria bacterium]|nr:hypothetical protein [Deltaproteobacteria bacterium]
MKQIGRLFGLALVLSMLALFSGCSASTDSQYDCVLDTDCEGNLLCRNGRCVNPNDPCLEVICDPGYRCQDGDCVPVDPCADMTCNTSPGDAACYDMPGTCAAGVCSYDMHANDSPCTDNDLCTSGDACQEGLCLGQVMVCDQPPSNDCIDENTLRSYTGIGRCAEGACAYDYSDINCSQGCVDGGCQGDPCAGVICNTPPEPSACYQTDGTCVSGGCQYDYNDGAGCDDGDPCRVQDSCSLGTCRGIPMDCSSPIDNHCDGDSAVIFSATGTCTDGNCSYSSQTVFCDEGCTDGACNGDPCPVPALSATNCPTPNAIRRAAAVAWPSPLSTANTRP